MGVNWNQGLMRWEPHVDATGKSYPLNHLHPFRFPLVVNQNEITLSVSFAMHCFSRETAAGDDPANLYSDEREQRTFCLERYALSKQLPQIVRTLPQRTCQFARNDNFVTIDAATPDGQMTRYGIFFNLKRWKDARREGNIDPEYRADVLLTVQSAYSLNPNKSSPGKGKIGFLRVVELTLDGVRPKPPRR